MHGTRTRSDGKSSRERCAWFVCAIVVSLALGCGPASAQQGEPLPSTPGAPYTLHVYEDLVDIPSLVLNSKHGSYRGLNAANFTIRLDSGPPFHPRHARLQGDDAVSFALLLDDSGGSNTEVLRTLDHGVPDPSPPVFQATDRLSVFAFDCNLVRSEAEAQASQARVRAGITAVLSAPTLHADEGSAGTCRKGLQLWDAIDAVAAQLSEAAGRRVLLVISNGVDNGSRHTWSEVRRYADRFSIAIFGLRPAVQPVGVPWSVSRKGQLIFWDREDPFTMLCAGTGGLVTTFFSGSANASVNRVVDLVRHRYILEFARPVNGTPGQHAIEVTATDPSAVIRTSGIAFPVQDKAQAGDPSTVPSDPNRAPVMGDRRILPSPR